MSDLQLDPRVTKLSTAVKIGGVGLVTVAASAAVVVTGASIAVAGVVGLVGLFTVNYLVPVAARSIALWRQKSLTALAETFSEETILEDERKEEERVQLLGEQYKRSRAELEGAEEELTKQLDGANDTEKEFILGQIQTIRDVILDAETTLETRKADLKELKRVNKLYIALHRSASAMEKAQGAERSSEEIQRIELARNSIKTKMRAAMAGQKIDQMDRANGKRPQQPTLPKRNV